MSTRYLIIGLSAAGIFGAEAIRRRDADGEITILSTEREQAYSRCLTTYYIEGKTDREHMKLRSADHWQKLRVDVRYGATVVAVDAVSKRVVLADGSFLPYDKLLIASGSSARKVPLTGAEEDEIYRMRTIADADRLISAFESGKKRVALFGGGLVSLKTAAALASRGGKLALVSHSSRLLSSQLDKTAASLLAAHMEECGVKLIFHTTAEKMLHNEAGECCGVALTNGEVLPCDLFFAGKGVTPNSDFVPAVKNEDGFILVDQRMQTNLPDVYAAGDVALSFDRLTGEPAVYAIWPSATEQGEIAGLNMAGADVLYRGAVSMNSLEFMGLKAIVSGDGIGNAPDAVSECRYIPQRKLYQKCVFRNGRLCGYILMGETKNAGVLTAHLGEELTFADCLDLLEYGAVFKENTI
ncbi:MAG: NAD(P)/FAD-dependent oxidoreductase [Firmicutes bacterium]|nr:NAD(P)/FAD-dependent oxidoreductase [Bacillota bacterium]